MDRRKEIEQKTLKLNRSEAKEAIRGLIGSCSGIDNLIKALERGDIPGFVCKYDEYRVDDLHEMGEL